jgi:3-dehydroquinate synthase
MSEFVHVDLKTCNYTIHIGSGLLHKAGELLLPVLASRRVVVISDEIVASLYLTQLQNSLDLAGLSYSTIVIPPGEGSKSLEQLTLVLDQLLNYKIDRNTTVIALGGGVIGDLAGFAAAIALRGLPFIQVPTTLLALVDSSIGGKTGINSWHGKNMIGSFHQPRAVLADVSVLDTLPLRHLRSGYAEMVKYSAIANPAFFSWLEQHGTAVLNGDDKVQVEAIRVSCLCKAAIVSADEYELGQRALLNLGHTFGHALEAVTEFSDVLLHGEAVAIGYGACLRLISKT